MEWLFLWRSVFSNVISLYHQMPLFPDPTCESLCQTMYFHLRFLLIGSSENEQRARMVPLWAVLCSILWSPILRGPWPGVDHCPTCLRGSSEGRPCSPWSRRISADGNKHHVFGTAFYSCKHFHTYYSQLGMEGILISFPFARWVNWDSERLNLLSRITQLLRSRTGTQTQMVPIDTESHKIQKEED